MATVRSGDVGHSGDFEEQPAVVDQTHLSGLKQLRRNDFVHYETVVLTLGRIKTGEVNRYSGVKTGHAGPEGLKPTGLVMRKRFIGMQEEGVLKTTQGLGPMHGNSEEFANGRLRAPVLQELDHLPTRLENRGREKIDTAEGCGTEHNVPSHTAIVTAEMEHRGNRLPIDDVHLVEREMALWERVSKSRAENGAVEYESLSGGWVTQREGFDQFDGLVIHKLEMSFGIAGGGLEMAQGFVGFKD